jgi:hypothetical protein
MKAACALFVSEEAVTDTFRKIPKKGTIDARRDELLYISRDEPFLFYCGYNLDGTFPNTKTPCTEAIILLPLPRHFPLPSSPCITSPPNSVFQHHHVFNLPSPFPTIKYESTTITTNGHNKTVARHQILCRTFTNPGLRAIRGDSLRPL